MEGIRENYGIVAKLHHSAISGLRQLEKDPDFGEYYLVMDLAEGEDLSAILRRRHGAPMPPAEALAILRPLASALDYAHAEKVLHRDVKPGNVKVSWGGASRPGEPQGGGGHQSAAPARPEASPHLSAPRVQLLDFGLAAEVRSSMSRVSMRGHAGTSGTPAYMAPEQWDAMRQSAATDQYALAAMAYQMLAGYLPFDADDTDLLRRAVLSRAPQPVKGLPGAANAALARALAKAPEARFPSCSAFVDALARAFDPRGVRRRFRLALAAVLLAGAAAAGVFFTQSRRAAEGGASRPGEPQRGGGHPSAVTARPEASPHLALPPDGEAGGASRPGEPQRGGGHPSAVGANGGLETAAPLADTDDPVASISAPSAVTARPEASPHLALPPDGASVAELRAARTAALDALDARRERFEPDDSPESAALLAAVSALDVRISAALEAEEKAAREAEEKGRRARAAAAKDEAQIVRLKAAAIRQERDVSAYRKWSDGEFKTQFDALEKAKVALEALSEANDLPAAEKYSATITAAVAWIEENAPIREAIDATLRAIDAMKTDLASAEAEKYAKAKLGAAETARSDADRLLARSRYAEAKTKCEEAKRLYDEAFSSASAERAAAKAAEAVALAEAAKIREDWDAVLVQSKEALRYQPQNASALALKREAEAEKMKIAEAKAEAERKAAQGGASRPGEPQRGGGLQSAVGAQGGASRPGEPQRGGGLPSAVEANGGLETAAPLAGTRTTVRVGSQEIALRWCPPGSFQMGSPSSEKDRDNDETQHRVTLTKGFYMGETEVTQGLWQEVMGANPSYNEVGDNYPVEKVSWNNCQDFLSKLNAKAPAGWRFALPTEAQWEYACRAGTTGAYGGSGNLDEMGWYDGNSGNKTHPVAQKRANAWGLYDMHGNVWEWCADWFGNYQRGAVTDPTGGALGGRVLRGGSYWDLPRGCRSAYRLRHIPGGRDRLFGFRLLATVEPQRGGGLQSAVGANGGLETAAPLAGRVTDNGHEGVQLWEGGPYWATTNIGADKPENDGLYFWWGDTVGYRREGDAWVASDGSNRNFSFSEANTPTYGKSESELKRSGWLTSTGVLAPAHDAAHVHWGGAWRMPTRWELDALRINCDWTWTTQNGSEGYLVRGRGAYSSASIFLPAAGYGDGTSLGSAGSDGYYRSSVPSEGTSYLAWRLRFASGRRGTDYGRRYYGQSVRPVQRFAK